MYWVVPVASGDFLGLGKSKDGSASCSPMQNLSTADLTEELLLERRRGVLGDSGVVFCAGELGDFGVLEEKRTRCCSRFVVLLLCSGSTDGDRGKREPGMVMEGRRLRARGRGGGEGIRRECVRGGSSVERKVIEVERSHCTNIPSSEGSGSLCRIVRGWWAYGSGDALFSGLRARLEDGDFFCEMRDISEVSES